MASRLLAGPALRLQPDSRLVTLFRDGYESAFEEIVRRYGAPLRRYAAAIVTAQRAEDVTQDALAKAFVALNGSEKEIQLRPWLYRILRNTALNALRDAPPASAELDETRTEGRGEPLDTLERREQIQRLVAGLRDLPEPQRAAIVMRELEGLSHEQIAASLGLTGGAVRQSIYRARQTLRDAAGLLLPVPFIRVLLDGGGDHAVVSGTAAAGGTAALGAAGAGGSAGVGIGVKAGLAALLAAGTVSTGVALDSNEKAAAGATPASGPTAVGALSLHPDQHRGDGSLDDNSGPGKSGGSRDDDNRGRGSRHEGPSSSGSGSSSSGTSGSGGSGSGTSGSGTSGSGSSGSGTSGSGSGTSGSGSSGSGSGSSGSGSGSSDPLDLPD